jgi:hypothetical protein
MNYTFGKSIEYLWRTSRNHLVHNACVKIPHVSKKQLSTTALCAATSAGCHHCLPLQLCCWLLLSAHCRCTLLHTCPSAARCCTHATSTAHCRTHAGYLPSIAIVPPSAAACGSTNACCSLPHPCCRCCILLHARPLHHCSRHHCHLHRCWFHVH